MPVTTKNKYTSLIMRINHWAQRVGYKTISWISIIDKAASIFRYLWRKILWVRFSWHTRFKSTKQTS